eukprot:2751529-Alexandrium_andersonii.AAC.1
MAPGLRLRQRGGDVRLFDPRQAPIPTGVSSLAATISNDGVSADDPESLGTHSGGTAGASYTAVPD